MVVVTKLKNEPKDNLFRRFTKTFIEEDIVGDARKVLFYKKPSLKRKDEEKERIKKAKKRIQKKVYFKKKW